MLRVLQSGAIKVVLYVVATLVLGAAMAPFIYNVGMAIAEVTADKETNGFLKWLGDAARRSADDFPRFYDRSLYLSAVLLLWPLVFWMKKGRGEERYRDTPWSLRYPDSVICTRGQPLQKNPCGWLQLIFGFLISTLGLFLLGLLLIQTGAYMWKDAAYSYQGIENPLIMPIKWSDEIRKAAIAAVSASLIEEIIFRGILLGIFLRAMRPFWAITTLSVLFAFVHFLEPPVGTKIADPEALNAGFILLGHILQRFSDFLPMVSGFSVIFAVGLVLAIARWKTASLWLPIGLHAGWVFSFKVFNGASRPTYIIDESTDSLQRVDVFPKWMIGNGLNEGILPVVTVTLTGIATILWLRIRNRCPHNCRQDDSAEPELADA